MSRVADVRVTGHTTSSNPRPHILYTLAVKRDDGTTSAIHKRYSEVRATGTLRPLVFLVQSVQFVALHGALGDSYALPPKRILTTKFVPSAWADDALISERKTGLTRYLSELLSAGTVSPILDAFLSSPASASDSSKLHPEDALPSTLSRKTALAMKDAQGEVEAAASSLIAASYYPDWAVDTNPPENIDFSKFDILFFGPSLQCE
jgi:chitinase